MMAVMTQKEGESLLTWRASSGVEFPLLFPVRGLMPTEVGHFGFEKISCESCVTMYNRTVSPLRQGHTLL